MYKKFYLKINFMCFSFHLYGYTGGFTSLLFVMIVEPSGSTGES